nr:MAG: hypothetical protein [Bacteriophage sp.]
MIPVNQFILGGSDPLLYPSEKMTNSIDEQIAFLQSQKQAINEAYRRNAIPNANNGVTQNQQVTNHYCKTIKGNYLRIVPFFIYLNLSMDKFIDVIVDGILSNFDFGFMFIVNVLTYIIIKVIDYFNGDNKVPTWQKRCVLVISIAAMAGIYIAAGYDNTIMLVNSAILAPVFWSWVVSPILKKLGVGYKDIDNAIG